MGIVYDAVIVGGGAAGLSAALVLGRARRSVIVIDDGRPRNGAAEFSHGFFTRDGERPERLLGFARADLAAYPSVRLLDDAVVDVVSGDRGFTVTTKSGDAIAGRKLLLATGVFDQLPDVAGLRERWGKSVFVCPFCDGWELRDQRIAVYGAGHDTVGLAQEMVGWTADVVVAVERNDLTNEDRRWISAAKVPLLVGRLAEISGPASASVLTLETGEQITCAAVFLSAPLRQHSPLFAALGCEIAEDGRVLVDAQSHTTVEGCYAAGDSVTLRHQVVIAAASGAAAAITLNNDLLEAQAAAMIG